MGIVAPAGTGGSANWHYQNSGIIGVKDYGTLSGITDHWVPLPETDCATGAFSIVDNIQSSIDKVEDEWSDWYFDHTSEWNAEIQYYQGLDADLSNLRDTILSRSYAFTSYKYCMLKADGSYKVVYCDGPESYNTCGIYALREMEGGLSGHQLTSLYFMPISMTDDVPVTGSFGAPVYTTLQDCLDYLYEDTPVEDPGEDPGTTGPGSPNTPIQPSTKIDEVAHTYLSSLTVIAEIDQQNLNYIGEALNNEIDLSQDVGQNLLKIARGIIQGNIADGIISIKSIPIPKGESLPYETGSVTSLFEPLGAHPVAGKKLNNFIKKYRIGEMRIEPIFNDFRDYLTEYSIYLPFSGIHRLDSDVIVGTKIIIDVDIDFYMGSMLYHIIINDTQTNRDIYQFTGDCAIEMPITSKDYGAKYQAIMNGVFSGVGMVAGGMMGGPAGATAGGMIAGIAGAGLKTAGNVASVKGNYMQTGKLIPNAACKSVLYPYLIVSKPQDVSPNYASVKGLPCHEVGALGNYTGFTVATQVNLDNVPYATDEDKEIIRSMLADGVYL